MQPGRILKVAIPILGLACLAVADLYPGQVAGPLSQTYQDFDDVRDLAERMTDENVKKNLADIVKTLDSMNQNLKRAADLWNGSSDGGSFGGDFQNKIFIQWLRSIGSGSIALTEIQYKEELLSGAEGCKDIRHALVAIIPSESSMVAQLVKLLSDFAKSIEVGRKDLAWLVDRTLGTLKCAGSTATATESVELKT